MHKSSDSASLTARRGQSNDQTSPPARLISTKVRVPHRGQGPRFNSRQVNAMSAAKTNKTEQMADEALALLWWMPMTRGVLLVLFAILMFIQPAATLLSLLWFMGIYWIVDGVFNLIEGVRGHAEKISYPAICRWDCQHYWWGFYSWKSAGFRAGQWHISGLPHWYHNYHQRDHDNLCRA